MEKESRLPQFPCNTASWVVGNNRPEKLMSTPIFVRKVLEKVLSTRIILINLSVISVHVFVNETIEVTFFNEASRRKPHM